MIVTFILKLDPSLLDTIKSVRPSTAFDELEEYTWLLGTPQVSMQVGDGRGRANHEFYNKRKLGATAKTMEFENREGYVLVRFTF